jgi:tetratricopeptide (TPR) repeat protein
MLAIYPDFAFAYFQMAMVHVARSHLTEAETVLRQGAAVQDRQIGRSGRFPALGLHWLLGLVRLALGDTEEALVEFDREAALAEPHRLYGREYAMCAQHARGAALLRAKRPGQAAASLRRALDLYPSHAPSHLGLATALVESGETAEAERSFLRAEEALAVLTRARPVEAGLVRSQALATRGRLSEAVAALDTLIGQAPAGFAFWTLPVEPLLAQLHSTEGFKGVLTRLSARAE